MASALITLGVQLWLNTFTKSVSSKGSTDVVQVASSCLDEVTYDVNTHTLGVTFKESGASYNYFNVPESEYENLVLGMGSVGETYNDTIKGSYLYARVA